MQITSIEEITWKFQRHVPKKTSDYPCMICGEEIATHILRCIEDTIRINLSVCPGCAKLEPSVIMALLKEVRP